MFTNWKTVLYPIIGYCSILLDFEVYIFHYVYVGPTVMIWSLICKWIAAQWIICFALRGTGQADVTHCFPCFYWCHVVYVSWALRYFWKPYATIRYYISDCTISLSINNFSCSFFCSVVWILVIYGSLSTLCKCTVTAYFQW